MSKPNKDGWIRHRGGKQPEALSDGDKIDVRYRCGEIECGMNHEQYRWHFNKGDYDIMAWRPHKPSILDEPDEPNEALKEVLELDAPKVTVEPDALTRGLDSPSLYIQQVGRVYRAEGDPRTMRDRIREIDAATIALNEERASLVAKLKAEGFVLIQSDETNGELESAQDDIAQQDMSDPANWRVGDLARVVSKAGMGSSEIKVGDIVRIEQVSSDGTIKTIHKSTWGLPGSNYEFVSRPPNNP